MVSHLVKLCVGVKTPADLGRLHKASIARQKKQGETPSLFHITRQTPKRRDDLLEGGSLYWVFGGYIAARQRILDIAPHEGPDGVKRCHIELGLELILTRPYPRRAFQGWRYLGEGDAPPDMGALGDGFPEDMPEALRAQLIEAGLL